MKQPQFSGAAGRSPEGAGLLPEVQAEDPRVSSMLERLGHLEGKMGQQLDHFLRVKEQQVCTSVCSVPATVLPHLTRCVQETPSAGALRNSTYAYLSATGLLLGLCSCKTPLCLNLQKLYSHWTICCMFRKRRCLHNADILQTTALLTGCVVRAAIFFAWAQAFKLQELLQSNRCIFCYIYMLTQTVFHLTC